MIFVPQFGHAKVYETSIWTPCLEILAKTMDHGLQWWNLVLGILFFSNGFIFQSFGPIINVFHVKLFVYILTVCGFEGECEQLKIL